MKLVTSLSAFSIALITLSLSATAQNVWVLDSANGPGADFTDLSTATSTAGDGDIILIRSGGYFDNPFIPSPIVSAKSLVLIADSGADVLLSPSTGFDVRNLAPLQTVAMRSIDVSGTAIFGQDNLGTLWIEDIGTDPAATIAPHAAAAFNNCSAAIINRCSLVGMNAFFPVSPGPSLNTFNSSVHVFDSTLQGGSGAFGHTVLPGSSGARISDSFLYASGSSFISGSGNPSPKESIVQVGPTSESILLDTSGNVFVEDGSTENLTGLSRSFEINSPVREGETLSITFTGVPGEIAILNLGLKPTGLFFDSLAGSALIDFPTFFIRIMGIIPASGTLVKNFTLNELGVGVEGVSFYSQGSFASTQGIVVGGGSLVVLLDDSF